jgi:cellulose synthase/poly-beta-1,6-N-acetylglucosamine synthase-like glycosyltransferase
MASTLLALASARAKLQERQRHGAIEGRSSLFTVIHFLTLICFGVPIFIFAFYGSVLFYFGKLKKDKNQEEKEDIEPAVSIVIPTHNETIVISKRIENLLKIDYPTEKTEIIFVDDSTDNTAEVIEDFAKKRSLIHLIKFRERIGYSPSVRAGCNAARNNIIIFGEAGSFMDRQAVRKLVRHFKDPKIGLVTGRSIITNSKGEVADTEGLYVRISDFVRKAESRMDSTFWVKGEATAVRKELIEDLDNCNATFDNMSALFVRKKGFKSIFDCDAKFYEYAPETFKDWGRQKVIRAANWIKILIRFKGMFFSGRYGLFGCITLPMFFSMLVVVPITLLLGMFFLFLLTFIDLQFSLIFWTVIGSGVILAFLLNRKILTMFFEFEFALLKAIYQVAFTKTEHDKIEKVMSTRTPVARQSQ